MNTRTRILVASSALAAGTGLFGACASTTSGEDKAGVRPIRYDSQSVAAQVRDAQKQAAPGLTVGGATCPEKVKVAKGERFECTVKVAGVPAPYTVTIESIANDKVHFHLSPAKAIVSTAKAEEFLAQQATAQGLKGVTVNCGGPQVRVQDPGTTFPCLLRKGGQTQKVKILVKNVTGRIAIAS